MMLAGAPIAAVVVLVFTYSRCRRSRVTTSQAQSKKQSATTTAAVVADVKGDGGKKSAAKKIRKPKIKQVVLHDSRAETETNGKSENKQAKKDVKISVKEEKVVSVEKQDKKVKSQTKIVTKVEPIIQEIINFNDKDEKLSEDKTPNQEFKTESNHEVEEIAPEPEIIEQLSPQEESTNTSLLKSSEKTTQDESILLDALNDSSSKAMILERENFYLQDELFKIQANNEDKIKALNLALKAAEEKVSIVQSEYATLQTQHERSSLSMSEASAQIETLTANLLQEKKEKSTLEQHLDIMHQDRMADKEQYEAEKQSIYKLAGDELKKSNTHTSAASICKSLETQFGIHIPYVEKELDDTLVMSTRIYKAITNHTIATNRSDLAEHSSKLEQTLATIAFTINSCLSKMFFTVDGKNNEALSQMLMLTSTSILTQEESFNKWLQSVIQAYISLSKPNGKVCTTNGTGSNDDSSSTGDEQGSKHAQNGSPKVSSKSSEKENYGLNRLIISDIYLKLVERFGKNVPTYSNNATEWVTEVVEMITAASVEWWWW